MVKLAQSEGKTYAVFGLGKAGMSTLHALLKSQANVFAWDDGEAGRNNAKNLQGDLTITRPEEFPWDNIEALLLSPGVPFTHPEPNPIVKLAQKENCPIYCDIELLYRGYPQANYIGITGTNGKSTTTSLVGHVLKEAGIQTEIGGNLGIPVLDLKGLDEDGTYVLEMSSYQLDLIEELHFSTTILLNFSPDHLDRHGGMAGYIKAKKRIFKNQGKEDTAIIGVDDEDSQRLFQELKDEGKIGTLVPISSQRILAEGISVVDGTIYIHSFGLKEQHSLGPLTYLPGKHNAQNIAATIAACYAQGVDLETMIQAIKGFKGLPHRMQFLTEKNGITFINDSKATNAEAASKALDTFSNIHWIVGGKAKDGGIESLEPWFQNITHAYLIGESETSFASSLEGKLPYTKCTTLDAAFSQAFTDASNKTESSTILLSPACASFDQFANFELRGEAFCKLVAEVD